MINEKKSLKLRNLTILILILTTGILSISCNNNQELSEEELEETYENIDSSQISSDSGNINNDRATDFSIDKDEYQESSINDDASSIQPSISKAESGASQNNLKLILIYTLICVTIIGLLFLSIYLYRWRLITLGDNAALVPEKWGKYLKQVGDAFESVNKTVERDLTALKAETHSNSKKLESMIETYLTLQNALDQKDQEIKRLKAGYDLQVFKKFLNRFIRVDQTIDEVLELDQVEKSDIIMIKRLLEDAFFECGLEKFEPEIGDNYLEADGVEDDPEKILSDLKEKEYQIAEIKTAGYHLKTLNGNEVISPAKVKIFINE